MFMDLMLDEQGLFLDVNTDCQAVNACSMNVSSYS